MIGALAASGLVASHVQQKGMKGWQFRVFIIYELCPKLKAGDLVLMDNLRAHKVAGVREAIEATGAKLLYLPPYSPDFSPIELFWSRLKAFLRKKAARTLLSLELFIDEALVLFGTQSATALFAHCGYQFK